MKKTSIVVGAGIFGLSCALALRARGWAVTVVDPGPIPHPRAASNDLSKCIRADYGRDDFYLDWMLEALKGWRAWNARWPRPLFHETGVTYLSGGSPRAGAFEHESATRLLARGVPVVLLDAQGIHKRYPQWAKNRFQSGYFNPLGGWAESGEVVAALARDAAEAGVVLMGGTTVLRVHDDGAGVDLASGSRRAETVVVATGAWTTQLVPELRGDLRSTAQSIFLLRPARPELWGAQQHPPFGADISATGWYGFPIHPTGLLKIAHHGAGWPLDADAERIVPAAFLEQFRDFLARDLPGLVDAPLAETRVCLYSDSPDGDFWIDRSPTRPALVVAAGGSGHAFKFGPVIGDVVVSVLEHEPHPARSRLAWRAGALGAQEHARLQAAR